AEDGIRDFHVTGVQTCALPICSDLQTIQGLTFYEHAETPGLGGEVENPMWKVQWQGLYLYGEEGNPAAGVAKGPAPNDSQYLVRSEERRVGKEWRSRRAPRRN